MLEIRKLDTNELEIGMYVSGLDRPWLETPFPLQGFRIRSEEEIAQLQEHCSYVFVDIQQSRKTAAPERKPKSIDRRRKSREQLLPGRTLAPYRDETAWEAEYPRAKAAVQILSRGVDGIFESVREGSPLDVVRVRRSVEPMIDSISRNPDACIWLARLKQQDQYTYQHSLATSVWSVALGRQLGLPKTDLRSLAVGGLLFDIGKLRLDPALLATEGPLDEEQLAQAREHVNYGAEMIAETGIINSDVIDMVRYHHERHDGSGYPEGLKDDNIPVFARIAAIVDAYDAMTSHRVYARAIAPSAAIKILHDARDLDFQAELVEEFIQAIGIYPAGTLVELSSGEVGVVVSEYRTRRLRPRLMMLLDADKRPLPEAQTLDLREVTHDARGEPLDIVTSLEPEAYGVDITGLRL